MKIGETSADSTIVRFRLTEQAHPNGDGIKWIGTDDREFDEDQFGSKQLPTGASLADMEGNLPA